MLTAFTQGCKAALNVRAFPTFLAVLVYVMCLNFSANEKRGSLRCQIWSSL